MAKFKALHDFHLIDENQDVKDGEIIELTVKRAEKLNKNTQKTHQLNVVERVTEEDKDEAAT